MARAYRCKDCRVVRTEKWFRCPGCHGFYDIQIVSADGGPGTYTPQPIDNGMVVSLDEIQTMNQERISTEIASFDKILGVDPILGNHGIAAKAGHIIQIYGDPGAGKSTLLMQTCRELTKQRVKVLYAAGEESLEQIKDRANRLGKFNIAKMRLLKETNLDSLLDKIEEEEPEIVYIDSVNMVEVDDYEIGSKNAIIIATKEFIRLAKTHGFGLFIVVQITKDGDFSGPKALEHMVDTSLHLRNNKINGLRTLVCETKNRFGVTPIYAHFKMTEKGLIEFSEPEEEGEGETAGDGGAVESSPKKKTRKKKKEERKLHALPSEGVHTPSTSIVIPENAAEVLAVSCDACGVNPERACTADSGVREAGFHQSRIAKSKLKIVPPKVETAVEKEMAAEEEKPPEPPLKGPPKKKRSKSGK